ncbi:MAG: nucleotidyltransferase domain-containing protein [Ignavibacteriae bacterium]|nr:nucleotidyltransferase domain-containing protein [Ignavibacteriota bacterium]
MERVAPSDDRTATQSATGKRVPSTREEIAAAIISVAKEIGASKAILFGSFARGTEDRRSDVDVVFVQETEERFVQRPDKALRMLYRLIRGRGIDVLIYTPQEFERMLTSGNFFITRVVREGKTLYES